MKIIQIVSQGSTGFFRKLMFIIILIILLIMFIAVGFKFYLHKDDFNHIVYKNADEVCEVFENNNAKFEKIIAIIDDNNVIHHLLEEESVVQIFSPKKMKPYLNDDDYVYVVDFWNELGPKYVRANSISFSTEDRDITVFKADNSQEDIDRYFALLGQKGEIIELKNNWYMLKYE